MKYMLATKAPIANQTLISFILHPQNVLNAVNSGAKCRELTIAI